MIEIGKKSKLEIRWNVSPYDFSNEKAESIRAKAATKYGIRKDMVRVVPQFQTTDDGGNEVSVSKDIIMNIQDPAFHMKLYHDYVELNQIEGADFDVIGKIDSEVNSLIDYQVFDKYRRYSIKWIKWDNFLSYGPDNFFDFTKLSKIVLLSGEPANQSGKTTLAIDLVRFLLFGKTNKAQTLEKVFNKYLPEATQVRVEGCINVDGEDFIIKRVLTRPSLEKRTSKSKTVQKVEYYKVIGSALEELEDYIEDMGEENSAKTNKAIKEAIGRESDFELIMSVTDATLDDLVNKKDAERGRLLSRWIGLLPLEQKDVIAREKYNSEVKPSLMSNRYNTEELLKEKQAYIMTIDSLTKLSEKTDKENESIDKDIVVLEKSRESLLKAMSTIDEKIMKVDIHTLTEKMKSIAEDGKSKNVELEGMKKELEEIGDVDFSLEEYDKTVELKSSLEKERALIGEQYKTAKKRRDDLKKGEICPTCGRKLENVDNSKLIAEAEGEMNKLVESGKEASTKLSSAVEKINSLKEARDKYQRMSKLMMTKAALEVNIEKMRGVYQDLLAIKKEYQKNAEAVDKNNEITIHLKNTDVSIAAKRKAKENNVELLASYKSDIAMYTEEIHKRDELLEIIRNEAVLIKNWKIYLELVGKNGISKMVLRKTLPIINAKLHQMLEDVCDFDVEVEINNKSEVTFNIVRDGVSYDISGGSGFELTASALALRAVLSEMSTIPKCSGIILDEIFGRVSHENYENMNRLVTKIAETNQYIWLISHNDEIKDWCNMNVIVRKTDNVSKIVTEQRGDK